VEHDARATERDVPVVGLVQVVVQADDTALLPVGAVRLDHLAPLREPLTPVRLDEDTAIVAEDLGIRDVHACHDVGLDDVCHHRASLRGRPRAAPTLRR
jgi:hypothetical protein